MSKILLVEDEKNIRHGIMTWFEKENFEINEAIDGEQAIKLYDNGFYDLIILDIMIPKKDGFEVLEYIRKNSDKWVPVIMLTAKTDEEDRILGLDLGADDYMTKPFSIRELLARVNSQLRTKKIVIENEKIDLFKFNKDDYTIEANDKKVELTKKEIMLLEYLIDHKNCFVSKDELLVNVWGYQKIEQTRTVDIHISKLRKKLEKIDCLNILETKTGFGYRLIDKND